MAKQPQEFPIVATVDSHLRNTNDLYGNKLVGLDSSIGHLRDFYFDDNIWVVRYAVADTASWLPGRLVLLSPHAFGKLDQDEHTLHINLRRAQIEDSPPIESHKPVSRQYEVEYYRYYGWPAYWAGDAMWGMGGFPVLVPPLKDEIETQRLYYHRDDEHLRSAREVTGYPIEAIDGKIGHVAGLLLDDRSWAIREVVVEAGHWYSGKEIRIPISKIERISYKGTKVVVNLSKADIQKTVEDGVAKADEQTIRPHSHGA
jgi:hypothetical protein